MIEQMSEVLLTLLLTSLAVGAVTAAMPRRGRGRAEVGLRARIITGAILSGLVSALILTVVNTIAPKAVNRQTVALWTLPPAILLAIALIILARLLRASAAQQSGRAGLERAMSAAASAYIALIVFRAAPTAFTQAIMVFPAGVELFSTGTVLALVGYALGWVIAAALGWTSARLCARGTRMWPLVIIVITLGTTHALMIVRILVAQRILVVSNTVFTAISWFINHEALFPILAMACLVGVAASIWYSTRLIPRQGDNPAESRLYRAQVRVWKWMAGGAAMGYLCGAILITVGVAVGSADVELSEPESYSVADERIVIDLNNISDGHLHRFAHTTSSGVEVRFIVIQKAGSSYGVGLDACEICGPSGYYEKDGKIICKLCEVAMNIATIGFKGGCNPIPIEYEVSNGTLTVPLSVLEDSASVFA